MWIIPSEFTEAIGRLGAVLPGAPSATDDDGFAEGRRSVDPKATT